MRFLFFSLASPGFLFPLVGIGKLLAKNGHEVGFVTDSRYDRLLEDNGLEYLTPGKYRKSTFELGSWYNAVNFPSQVKMLRVVAETFSPDVIVTHYLAYSPLYVAEIVRTPIAILGLAAYVWPTTEPCEHIISQKEAENRSWQHNESMKLYRAGRELLRLAPQDLENISSPVLGDLFLLQNIPVFERDENFLPQNVKCVGSCLWEPEVLNHECIDWLKEAKQEGLSVLFVQLGRVFDGPSFWPYLLDVLETEPVKVIATTGRAEFEIESTPNNFLICDHLPQGAVLPHSDGVIANGHTWSVLGAISHGLPMLLFPNGSGTYEIARRCSDAGIAVRLNINNLDRKKVLKAVRMLLNHQPLKQQAVELFECFKQVDGPRNVAHHIEELVANTTD